jgi:hypothetical protein
LDAYWRQKPIDIKLGRAVAGRMLDADVAGIEILVQQTAAVKTLWLVGGANSRSERVLHRFAHHTSNSVDDVSEARERRFSPTLQDVLVAVATAPT